MQIVSCFQGESKGAAVPWHTTLLVKSSVLYLSCAAASAARPPPRRSGVKGRPGNGRALIPEKAKGDAIGWHLPLP